MLQIYLELAPIFLLILSGILLRYFKIIKKEDAAIFLRLVFYLTMPALVLTNIPNTAINTNFILLPVIPPIMGSILFFISQFIGKKLVLEKKTQGVFIISSLILNTAFAFPFISIIFKEEGIARLLIFDVGNVIMIFSFAYFQACKYGNHTLKNTELYKKFLNAIPLWAILISVAMNLSGVKLQGPVYNFTKLAGDLTIPLLLISVGVFFEPKLIHLKASFIALFIRIGMGTLLGIALVSLFKLEGITKYVAILCTATPVGYNTLTFSSIENLDKEFAAGLVSNSILFALGYVPLIIYFLTN